MHTFQNNTYHTVGPLSNIPSFLFLAVASISFNYPAQLLPLLGTT